MVVETYLSKETKNSGIINVVLNSGIAWLLFKSSEIVPMWGDHGFAFDLVVTAFLLLFITSLILIPVNRKKVSRGDLSSFEWDDSLWLHRFLIRFPRSVSVCALIFGLIGLFIYAPVSLLLLVFTNTTEFSAINFAIFKGLWAGLLAVIMIRPILLIGLGEMQAS